jgi:hypothetical protein
MAAPQILVAVLAVLATGATVWFVLHRRRLLYDLSLLSEEDRERHSDIIRADAAVRAAQKAYDAAVKESQAHLEDTRIPEVLAQCGAAILTDTSVILNGRTRPLTPGIRVDVDPGSNEGQARDARQPVLAVTGPDWQELVPIYPGYTSSAHRFAGAVATASPRADRHLQVFHGRVAAAERRHGAVLADSARLDAARQARALLEADPLLELRASRKLAKA